MARSSLTYIPGFSVKFLFQPIYSLYSSNLGTFWLKTEQFWPFEEISIFSNSGHLEWRAGLSDTILKGTHPGTYMARNSLTYIPDFSVKFFFQPIYTDYAN
jgi:hypothetical protein